MKTNQQIQRDVVLTGDQLINPLTPGGTPLMSKIVWH